MKTPNTSREGAQPKDNEMETVESLITSLGPHTAYVEMEIRLGLTRMNVTPVEEKIAEENWRKNRNYGNGIWLDLRSQRCRELRLIRRAYEIMLERDSEAVHDAEK